MKLLFISVVVFFISFFSVHPSSSTTLINSRNDTTITRINSRDSIHGPKYVTNYQNGKLNGKSYQILPDGDTIVTFNYKDDSLDGESINYYSKNRIGAISYYDNGYQVGTWKVFDTSGNIISTKTFATKCNRYNRAWSGETKFYKKDTLIYTNTVVDGNSTITVQNAVLYAALKTAEPSYGEQLYQANCTMCHFKTTEEFGPFLNKHIIAVHKKDWLIKFIENGNDLYLSGDPTAIKVYEQFRAKNYGNIKHPDLSYLKKTDIEDILEYINKKS
jgi:hypothetical protein